MSREGHGKTEVFLFFFFLPILLTDISKFGRSLRFASTNTATSFSTQDPALGSRVASSVVRELIQNLHWRLEERQTTRLNLCTMHPTALCWVWFTHTYTSIQTWNSVHSCRAVIKLICVCKQNEKSETPMLWLNGCVCVYVNYGLKAMRRVA